MSFSSEESHSCSEMPKPLSAEAIAINEKKMGMTLDDIIKMSNNTGNKAKKQRRFPSKFLKSPISATLDRPRKFQHLMSSRSSLRQGALAKRRSNFQGNQFALATEVARKAEVAPIQPRVLNCRAPNWNKTRIEAHQPIQRRPFTNATYIAKVTAPARPQMNATSTQRPQTLDLMFANMKEQRLRALSHRQSGAAQQRSRDRHLQIPPWGRSCFGMNYA